MASNNNNCDVLIVYDRMKQKNDILKGNNVAKYFVINSYRDYISMNKVLDIVDKTMVITREGSKIGNEAIRIPTIQGYEGNHNNADLSSSSMMQYFRIVSTPDKKQVLNRICESAKIILGDDDEN